MQYSEPLKKEDKPFGDLVQKIALENGFAPFGTVGLHDAAPMPAPPYHETKVNTTKAKWAGSDSNQRPPPCQGGILTRLDHRPTSKLSLILIAR
jgi:hypothetical protein